MCSGSSGCSRNAYCMAVHPDDQPRMQAAWRAWTTSRTPEFVEECRIVRRDGTVRWVSSSGTVTHDAGAILRLSVLTRDITEQRVADDARRLQVAAVAEGDVGRQPDARGELDPGVGDAHRVAVPTHAGRSMGISTPPALSEASAAASDRTT